MPTVNGLTFAYTNDDGHTLGSYVVKCNLSASGAPTSANDDSQGYKKGSLWISSANNIYMCANASTGAAVWRQLN